MKHSKKIALTAIAAAVITMTGCSSTGSKSALTNGGQIDPGVRSGQSIADQRLAVSDFKRQGVRVIYSLGGEVEAIEVTGYAPVWGGSQNAARESFRAAEMEAKKSLNDFINKETISSTVSVRMISENLEHARDQKTNSFGTNRATQAGSTGTADDLIAVDDQVAKQTATGQEENTASRNDALKIAQKINTTIVATNRGIIGGLYLVEGKVINDGQNVQVTMRWDKKHNLARTQIRNLMAN
jgi:hypothetical protein